mgnify:CR=1 FL=1
MCCSAAILFLSLGWPFLKTEYREVREGELRFLIPLRAVQYFLCCLGVEAKRPKGDTGEKGPKSSNGC